MIVYIIYDTVILSLICESSESEVAQSCPTLCDPIDCSLPGFFIHGIFQARVLEWVAIAFSASRPYHWIKVSGMPYCMNSCPICILR